MADSIYPDRSGSRNANFRGGSFHNCANCGARVWVVPARARDTKRHFCDRECLSSWHAVVRSARPVEFQGTIRAAECRKCKRNFLARLGDVKRGRALYCSRKCWRASVRVLSKACSQCGAKFIPKAISARFCSQFCKSASQCKIRTPREIAQRKLEVRIASLMGYSLKGKKAGCKWESLVGYTLADLMAHLESKFAPGMTWSNIGDWHIDHRRPRSAFLYESPADPEFKACWALANLQPLWAVDNMSKGARLDWRPAA